MTLVLSFLILLILALPQKNILAEGDVDSTCQNFDFNLFHSCTANEEEHFPLCYCDALCHLFDDCCRDAPKTHNLTAKELEDLSETHRVDDSSCTPIPGARYQYGVWMVEWCNNSLCPVDPNDLLSYTPVTDLQGLTYRNKECAECNGVKKFTSWYPKFFDLQEDDNFLDDVQQSNASAIDVANTLMRKIDAGTVALVMEFDVTHTNVPRFCFDFNDERNVCPPYVSPYIKYCQRSYILSRNNQCAGKYDGCDWEGCLEFFNPFEAPNLFRGSPMPVTILMRNMGNDNDILQTSDASTSFYVVEVQYLRVNYQMMFQTAFLLDRRALSIYVESILLSFYFHSGYKLRPAVENIFIFNQRVPCQVGVCIDYFVVLEMLSYSILKENDIQELLNLKFRLTYYDSVHVLTNLTVQVSSSDVSAFADLEKAHMDIMVIYVNTRIYDDNDLYEYTSELINCLELLIRYVADMESMPKVYTNCLRKRSEIVTNVNNRIIDVRHENGGNFTRNVSVKELFILLFFIFYSLWVLE